MKKINESQYLSHFFKIPTSGNEDPSCNSSNLLLVTSLCLGDTRRPNMSGSREDGQSGEGTTTAAGPWHFSVSFCKSTGGHHRPSVVQGHGGQMRPYRSERTRWALPFLAPVVTSGSRQTCAGTTGQFTHYSACLDTVPGMCQGTEHTAKK